MSLISESYFLKKNRSAQCHARFFHFTKSIMLRYLDCIFFPQPSQCSKRWVPKALSSFTKHSHLPLNQLILGSNESTKTPWSYQNCRFINITNQAIFKVCNLPFVHHFISSLALKQNRCPIASASRSPKDPMLTPGGKNSRVPINKHAWKLAIFKKGHMRKEIGESLMGEVHQFIL